uniref:chondroitin sulfate proteoglycan 4 isoform X6 n=1 Tax=Ciona intestinalis TaxID=7719 RepID=UPI000EF44281|nr:chondroitin sulfate proteoglycan 4 isoform X6 [Ciona intestinalis]|eukprot:XP_026689936.1 chondroitin sulfate proteoglycan 4 isoform X6 [Ciona intestinalis]
MSINGVLGVLVCLMCPIIFSTASSYSASFYGNSFLFERLSDNSADTTLSLQFQTRALNGVILIAAGQTDYLIVCLRKGRLEIRIKTGQKEEIFWTPAGVKYNNLLWHEVQLIRVDKTINVDVNRKNVLTKSLSLNNTEDYLNIDLGVFLGGYDSNIGAALVPEQPFFRGCILSALYNGVDVLDPIMNVHNHKIVHNVYAGCSKIFRARPNEPLSFTSSNAFLSLPQWTRSNKAMFECQIKTRGKHGLILFNSGSEEHEFVGIEMSNGRIGVSLNTGEGVFGLQSNQFVNDGKWHRLRLKITLSLIEIRVDTNRTKILLGQEHSSTDNLLNMMGLNGPLYIAGVDSVIKHRALFTGMNLASFPGCIKSVRVNMMRKTAKDYLTTNAVSVGCSLNSSLLYTQPELPAIPTFVIVPSPSKPEHKQKTLGIDRLYQSICYKQTIHNMSLFEGGTSNISQDLIQLQLLSNSNKRIRNNNVFNFLTFNLTVPPHHGKLFKHGNILQPGNAIPMQDIQEGSVVYVHDGSETLLDHFNFTVGTVGLNTTLKDLKKYHLCSVEHDIVDNSTQYSLYIEIQPVNDAPVLTIPPDYTFTPIKHSKTPLPGAILKATDHDSKPADIIYHMVVIGSGLYIENRMSTGRPIEQFTQQDLDQGQIYFVHAGGPDRIRLLIQVSNKNSTFLLSTTTSVLRVSARPLTISVFRNTGIALVEGESKVLTLSHLNVSTNAGKSEVEINYNIVTSPTYGQIQILSGDKTDDLTHLVWNFASHFTQSDLKSSRVRYLNVEFPNTDMTDTLDRFLYTVSAAGVTSDTKVFNITLIKVVVTITTTAVVIDEGNTGFLLTTNLLNVSLSGIHDVSNEEIQFVLQSDLSYGSLVYGDTGLTLSYGDYFTLGEVTQGQLHYELYSRHINSQEHLFDHFELHAIVRGRYNSLPITFNITYIPDTKSVKITSNVLQIDEGGEQTINRDLLFAETLLHHQFAFVVYQGPTHGSLLLNSPSSLRINVTSFTTRDIIDRRLKYRHDGSEFASDFFHFTVQPFFDGELPEKLSSVENVTRNEVFNISISLINDNSPVRMINKPFDILRHFERLITSYDIWYHDPDLTDNDLDLKYVRRGISNGDIVNATSRKKIFEFTQRDIVSNQVLFRHRGRDFGRFVFWVKDGKHFATGLFVVIASPAFVHITNNTQLLAKKSENTTVSSVNINTRNNVDSQPSHIIYRITEAAKHGKIIVTTPGMSTNTFTQHDINEGKVIYAHDGSSNGKDRFGFSVQVGAATTNGNVAIRIFTASQQRPPVIKKNEVLIVEEGGVVQIKRSDLRAAHSAVRTKELIFQVTSSPVVGILVVNQNNNNLTLNASSFSQWDINHGFVRYQQNKNISYQENPMDRIIFTVTNGILSLTNVVMSIDIIPYAIPLRSGNFSVDEGMSGILIEDYLSVDNQHFISNDINIDVVMQPMHGQLESTRNAGIALQQFSLRLVVAEFVYYVHDGSDTILDKYQLQASLSDGTRKSHVVTTYISIIPDNDQTPWVVNNTGMQVWVNSTSLLTNNHLAALDLDTPSAYLFYNILPPHNGYLSLITKPYQPVVNFTQAHIDNEQLYFVHTGAYTGGFTFQVNDGLNYDVKHIFVIQAQPLVISITGELKMQIFPNTTSEVSSSVLHGLTNDNSNDRMVTFNITRLPNMGRILKVINHMQNTTGPTTDSNHLPNLVEVTTFTQQDINMNLIMYQQTTTLNTWSVVDTVEIKASSQPARNIKNIELLFNISYDAYQLANMKSPIQINKGASVLEGGHVDLTSHNLDARNLFNQINNKKNQYKLRYKVLSLPMYGTINVNNERITEVNISFTHEDLSKHVVTYSHDDSEHFHDKFSFTAYLLKSGKHCGIQLYDEFNIAIMPVNDNPPEIITKAPFMQVVQGFVKALGRDNLVAKDIDNPPSDITYVIIRPPTYGQVMYVGDTATTNIDSFTQDDVNHGRILFKQNEIAAKSLQPGHDGVLTDAFYFSLSDGFHRPSYTLFRIKIVPVVINMSISTLMLEQGTLNAPITSQIINATTNGDFEFVQFVVVEPPQSGVLMMDNHERGQPIVNTQKRYFAPYTVAYNSCSLVSYQVCNFGKDLFTFCL